MSENDPDFPGARPHLHPPPWRFFLPGSASMTARRGQMTRELARALASATLRDEDAAAVQLARNYAALLDDARFWQDQVRLLSDEYVPESASDDRRLRALERAVESGRTLATVGPKLLTLLTALGLTAAGRAATVPPPAGERVPTPEEIARDEIRQRRARTGR